ncbi:MAG TPA: AAA family ATPase [Nitrospirae bacterium]|nr:AAA family ATPase [Nitrospirota bacterium]HDK81037.1 AAA family ATPase [Nitrospirota bacterium]
MDNKRTWEVIKDMKRVFVKTHNVKAFIGALDRIKNRPAELPGLALIFGDPGLGKTKTSMWWCAQKDNDGIFLRTKKLMTGRWLLEELVAELGEAPMWKTSDLFRQAIDQLLTQPRIVFVDEIDYLTRDARVIETLRDIHDITGSAFIFLGMSMADKKLMRYRHLYDRFSEILKFNELTEADVSTITLEMCEVKLKDDAVKFIYGQTKRFRSVVKWLYKAEHITRTNNLKEVKAEHLQNGRR